MENTSANMSHAKAFQARSAQESAIGNNAASMYEVSDRILRMFESIRVNKIPRVHLERAMLFTESFRETEGQPLVLRWAKALDRIARNITVRILDDELIVGRPHPNMGRYGFVYPELDGSMLEDAVSSFGKRENGAITVTDEDKDIMLNVLYPYWKDKDFPKAFMQSLPEDSRNYIYGPDKNNYTESTMIIISSIVARHSQNWFHDYEKVIKRGFASIRDEANQRLSALKNPADVTAKGPFYEAVVIVCNAIITYARRYAHLAETMAQTEKRAERKAELLQIAETCRRVPEFPARTFQEGVQAQWFTQLFSRFEQNVGGQISDGRIDQYLYPLYASDKEKGSITPERACELLQCLWLNMWQSAELRMIPSMAEGFEGFAHFESVTIGGQTPEGFDATNDVTYLALESARPLQCTYPELAVRIHSGTPEKLLHAVAEVIKDGKGIPKLLNDDVIVPFYLANGAPYAEALDYGASGCVESRLPNRETHVTANGHLNYGALIEMTINDGKMKRFGNHQFGPRTGDPRTFVSYEDFWNAFKAQMLAMTDAEMRHQYVANAMKSKFFAAPFASSLHNLAMESGMDLHRHGEYIPGAIDLSCLESIGLGTAIDSLAAVKKLVYDEHRISMDELIKALDADFEGYEDIRQMCLNAPKYANNDAYADNIGRRIITTLLDFLHANPKPHNQGFMLRCIPITFHVPAGKVVAATPNGRKSGVYLSEGVSASHGADVDGPTSALRSIAYVRPVGYREKGADLLNMKFSPANVAGEEGTRRLMSFIRAWRAMKLWHIQFNIINKETLLAARADPDKYRNLVVRVAGYSAYFVDLSPELQAEIIDRTEESFL